MPTYQYACTACEHRFEAVQSFSDDALSECPQCQGRLRKLFTAVGVVFKGSGFYRNDSRSHTSAASSESATSDATSDAKSDSKSDSKPGAKPGAKPGDKAATAPASSTSGGDSSAPAKKTAGANKESAA